MPEDSKKTIEDPLCRFGTGGNPDPTKDRSAATARLKEVGGRDGPDPTRFGDWEKNGRCVDF